jgi:hypothetical protein
MPSFSDVESEEPEFAARVRAAFDAHGHTFLATLRADGSPRISGIEMHFVSGEPWLAGMPRSVKFTDLRRDPRFALHSGSAEPDAFEADAKLSGRAVEVTDPAERAAYAESAGVPGAGRPGRRGTEPSTFAAERRARRWTGPPARTRLGAPVPGEPRCPNPTCAPPTPTAPPSPPSSASTWPPGG